ncbi:MAG: hypothetical protein EXR66_04420 [Dehalococcoidia bacterium]|nr:hypothetical protein [Dehalococcoidia bacterium]
MPLLHTFRDAVIARGLLEADARIEAATAFTMVRDMPYERASDARPETLIEEWRGTCSGKHLLLAQLLGELGLDSMFMTALHEFTTRNSPWLPPHLLAEVQAAPIPDVHNFLMVESPAGWFAVDATWPLATRALGLPANEVWTPGRNMTIAADVDEVYDVPEDADPLEFKGRVIADHVGMPGTPAHERRERFIEALSAWLKGAPALH